MEKKGHVISRVVPGSIAEELELKPGDRLMSINHREVEDVFDYQFLIEEEYIELLIYKADGEEWELEIEKDDDEDIGLEFESSLMDEYRSCRNKCMFCFIDQMPEGMRDTLYFKDDDSRLSFLQGNYITLTNMSDRDIERIIEYKLSPINISFHTTNPELRCKMLHNRFAGDALKKAERLARAGIEMNGQIVLCRGINDGGELDRSIRELSAYLPHLRSLSVVPVGLTRFRDGLDPLEAFDKETARQVLSLIHGWQDRLFKEQGTHFVQAGDEWYILAGEELPPAERYDGFIQLENGVGMLRLLLDEFAEALLKTEGDDRSRRVSIATGVSAYPYICSMAERIKEKFGGIDIIVYPVVNHFFGERITVSGLLTGQDLEAQLKGKDLGDTLLLPCNILRSGEAVFLDDMTLEQLEKALQADISIVKSSGQDFMNAVIGL